MACSPLRTVSLALLASAGLLFSAQAQAPLDIRIALVIGNSAYASAPLVNPANDANAMANTLKQLGFTVKELQDGSKAQMGQAITEVQELLKGRKAIGLLYYAGHGLQLDWRNYMVPVDARIASAGDIVAQAVDVNNVIDAFKTAGNRMNILVLDACRDNPFGSLASGKGLAQLDAPPGTFLAYATAPGNVAEDGDVRTGNGLYTQYLLEELKKPAARIEDVFKRVRMQVRQKSLGRQVPWESTSLEDDFVFNSGVKIAPRPEVSDRDRAFAQQKAEWEKIKDSRNVDDFYAFVQAYPGGFVSELAQGRIEQLQKAQVVQVPNRDGVVQVASSRRRFELGDVQMIDRIDGFSKQRRRFPLRVTAADDNRAEINGGRSVWDQSGAILKNESTHTPGILQMPNEMSVGKKWKTAYQTVRADGVNEVSFWEYHVTGYDLVTVPEGTFKAYLVVGTGEARFPGGVTVLESRSWFDPASLRRIRYESKFRIRSQIVDWFIEESVAFSRSAR